MKINDRFELDETLGVGQAITRAGIDTQTGHPIVAKELAVGRVGSWKEIELFEREARVLSQLDHPQIPSFIDAFAREPDEGPPEFWLILSRLDGTALSAWLDEAPLDAAKVRQMLHGVLDILCYLQDFRPPVLHRDIKPANILERDDGTFALVDFGAVQLTSHDTRGGSTVVGTSGYMAPEQLMGRAVAASDLYSLGATAVHLLTGLHPDELVLDRMKLRWREHAVTDDHALLDFVDRLVEPTSSRRIGSAEKALDVLSGRSAALVPTNTALALPERSGIEVVRSRTSLELTFPRPARKPGREGLVIGAILVAFSLVAIHYTGVGALLWFAIGGLFVLWDLRRQQVAGKTPAKLRLDVNQGYLIVSKERNGHPLKGTFEDIIGPDLGHSRKTRGSLFFVTRNEVVEVADGLSEEERRWAAGELEEFVRAHRR